MALRNHFYKFISIFFLSIINKIGLHNTNKFFKTCTYQGIRYVSFSENFAYVLNPNPDPKSKPTSISVL